MTDFLHGTRSSRTASKNNSVREVKSSVVFLVGISPTGPVQQLVKCMNETDDAQFGAITPANDIAMSLSIIRKAAASTSNPGGSGAVIVVNVFDDTLHTATLNTTGVVTGGKFALRKHLYGAIVVKKADNSTVSTSKYTFDEWGNFTDITSNAELEGLTLTVTGKYVIPAVAADIVGAVDSNNVRTGMKLHALCYNTFGYNPKIIITPKYATLSAVFAEGRAVADANRAIWLHDNVTGDSVTDAIAERGPSGTSGWNTSHKRSWLLYPYLTTANAYEAKALADDGAVVKFPYSAFMAGAIIKNDNDPERGYANSPSNMEINGAVGAETVIGCSWTDSNAENQQLNAAGITTYLTAFGIGLKTWGNRLPNFPAVAGPETFINIQRVDDIVAESIELAYLNYNDRTITRGLIEVIREFGNSLVAKLIQQGKMLPGSEITYSPADNSVTDLGNGNVKFRRRWMTGTPAELIEEISQLDVNLFKFINK